MIQCNRFLDGQLNQILMITRSHAIYSESCNIRKGLLNNTILHYTTLHYTRADPSTASQGWGEPWPVDGGTRGGRGKCQGWSGHL